MGMSSFPLKFKTLNPKAAAIPIPASFVAEPPMSRKICFIFLDMAS